MASWIKFHRSIRKGAKRAYSRATRFVYLELAEEARETGGVIDLPPRVDLVDAVHDLLGGSREEIAIALGKGADPTVPHLLEALQEGDAPMVAEVTEGGRRTLRVVTFEKWNRTRDDSSERVRRHRQPAQPGKAKSKQVAESKSEARNGSGGGGVTDSSSSPLLSSSLISEGVQGETPARPAAPPARTNPRADLIAEVVVDAEGLFGTATADRVWETCERIAKKLDALEPEHVWSDLHAEIAEWCTHVRKQVESARTRGEVWSDERALTEFESKATQRIRYRPGDARKERDRAQNPAKGARRDNPSAGQMTPDAWNETLAEHRRR